MVRDLHHVDRTFGAGGEQRVLRILPEVAEEDRCDPAALGLHGEAARVSGVHAFGGSDTGAITGRP